jgi:hypothetical protein
VAKPRFSMTCVSLSAAVQVVFLQVGFAQVPPPPPVVPSPAPARGAAAPYDGSPPQLLQPPNSAPPIAAPVVKLRADNPRAVLQRDEFGHLHAVRVVTLRADNPRAVLQQLQLRWRDICVSPCGVPVDPAGTYRIAGDTIRPSTEFRMPPPSGPVLIDTQTGSAFKHGGGLVLAIGGGVSALAGVLYLVKASTISYQSEDGPAARGGLTGIGLIYLAIGGVLMAVGIPLSRSSTEVSVFSWAGPPGGGG